MPQTAPTQSKFGAVLRATAGNFLEMFDFFLFGLYAAPIGKAFFATGDEFTDTSIAFVVFWLGAADAPARRDFPRRLCRQRRAAQGAYRHARRSWRSARSSSPSRRPMRTIGIAAPIIVVARPACCRAFRPASSSAASPSISPKFPSPASRASPPRSSRRASRSRCSSAR